MKTTWYVTHAGADYAYPACPCDFTGTVPDVYAAPPGMVVAGEPGKVVPDDGWAEEECGVCVVRMREES